MSHQHRHRVEQACLQLTATRQPVTFDAVAARAGISRATLYRNADLRTIVEEHRQHQHEARTLSGLTTEIAHLRTTLEAIAANVRRHEEQLRRLQRQHP
jgi:AcrR family transcriptional regulator